jgi:hypothetical protein
MHSENRRGSQKYKTCTNRLQETGPEEYGTPGFRDGCNQPGRVAAKDGKFKNEQAWGKACFEDLERRGLGEPATTSWSTDFLVREGVCREELGK